MVFAVLKVLKRRMRKIPLGQATKGFNGAMVTKKDQPHNNHELYRDFFRMIDRVDCQFAKLCGHRQTARKD